MFVKWLPGRTARAAPPAMEKSEIRVGRSPWVLHPFLIGAFPIVSLYAHNVNELPLGTLVLPIVLTLVVSSILWLSLRLPSGDPDRAGLATTLLVSAFFGFQGICGFVNFIWSEVNAIWVAREVVVSPLLVLGLLGVTLGGVIRLIFWRLGEPARWTRVLNAFTIILVAMPVSSVVSARWRETSLKPIVVALPGSVNRSWTPDIYFIVLDGFARVDVMKDLYGLDTEPFLQRLERRGFFVGRQSTSNYCQTRLSLASTLNANYLEQLVDVDNPDLVPLAGLISDSLVRKLLRPLGYQFVSFATGFDPTEIADADVYLKPRPGIPAFQRLLVEMTPLGIWLAEVEHNDLFSALRAQTLFLLDRLPTVAGIKEPTFTFAHILAPHPPFVFGRQGEDVSPRHLTVNQKPPGPKGLTFDTPKYVHDAYRDESVFIMAQVDRMIDRILANSPQPPVIILQSDHGAFLRYHPENVEATDLRERFGILNAVLVPGRKVAGLNDRMTSVNTFRAVLSEVVGADLPPLEQRSYFSTFQSPLQFIDITERLHSDREKQRTFTYPNFYLGLL